MPKFPEISPEITCNHALNMILASIAMEELALSHIINAEGEKLQYVLGTLETSCGQEPTVDEILSVNQSMTSLLDSVSQNQIILKSKMDKAIQALSSVCPGHTGPTEPSCKCSAVFRTVEKCQLWRAGSALDWDTAHIHGECIRFDPCDKDKIIFNQTGRFNISFAVNARLKSCCKHNAAIGLQMISKHQRMNIYNVYSRLPYDDTAVTISISGIMVEISRNHLPSTLLLRLMSPDSLVVENSMLSIFEI